MLDKVFNNKKWIGFDNWISLSDGDCLKSYFLEFSVYCRQQSGVVIIILHITHHETVVFHTCFQKTPARIHNWQLGL